ncbi:MAG TPA: prepilin-type N-terminal cleavage/methylation domain-containing protein, partial [Verrucomicrobiae bacterium]|nr:prepilin-type N-terminal cleavage/methylation domain-containing protein [Verrucomicrobiae bacterium]
ASSQRGFTLLELLTSMTLLLVMVGFLAVAFNSASVAWKQGEKDVDRYQQARATVDLMARDLSQAVVSPKIQFYGITNGLAFMAPVSDNPNVADLAEVAYVLGPETAPPFTLKRRFTTAASSQWDIYTQPTTWPSTADNVSVVSDAVINFTVTYYDAKNTQFVSWNSTSVPGWTEAYGLGFTAPAAASPTTMLSLPPAYVNVHLEVVDSKTARVLRNMAANPIASANLMTNSVRAFDVYLRIPQR